MSSIPEGLGTKSPPVLLGPLPKRVPPSPWLTGTREASPAGRECGQAGGTCALGTQHSLGSLRLTASPPAPAFPPACSAQTAFSLRGTTTHVLERSQEKRAGGRADQRDTWELGFERVLGEAMHSDLKGSQSLGKEILSV